MKKQTGIWLDFSGADVIHLEQGKVNTIQVASGIEDFHLVGGARSKVPYGPMDKTSESKHLERRKHQTQRYFQELLGAVADSDELFVMGPAEAKIGFRKFLRQQNNLRPALLDVQSADSISLNQKIAKVKDFFKY